MFQDKKQFLNILLESYETYFDVARNIEKDGMALPAEAVFHSRSEKYVLVQSAKLWAVETNEYVYFITDEISSIEEFKTLVDKVLKIGMREIKPHSEHMYSYITMVYLADSVNDSLRKAIRNFSYHRMFLLSLQGWMHFRLAAVDLSKNLIITNKKGREVKELLEKVMQNCNVKKEADV